MLNYLFLTICCFQIFDNGNGMFVDMSYPYKNTTLYWPDFKPFEMKIVQRGYVGEGEYQMWIEHNEFSMPEHLGTHMDSPAHVRFHEGGWRLDQIPVSHFIGDAVVIDISGRANENPDATLEVSDIEAWEDEHGEIKRGSIVFLYSGWEKYWGNEAKYFGNDQKDTSNFHFPGFSKEAAQWLVDFRAIYGVGVDTISIDAGNNGALDAHKILLGANIYGLENVHNLAMVPPFGAKVFVFPIKIADGSGGACRIVAEFYPPIFDNSMTTTISLTMFMAALLASLQLM